jgi:uncharacterized protein (TIGR00288 family)
VSEPRIAVFVDFENLAHGVKGGKFQIELVLKRLLEKGRIVYKRAYSDWGRYREYVRDFHAHGIELIDIPQSKASGKNSADIRMVVDALDLCYAKQHIDVFALLTGDSDFSPLVSKLKENDKRVVGCGVKNSTSDLLIGSCDEFIYYDDLSRDREASAARRKRTAKKTPSGADKEEERREEGFEHIAEIVQGLQRDYDVTWGSMVKQALNRVYPGFDTGYYGFSSFSQMLEAAEKAGYVSLEFDEDRGNYVVHLKKD